MLANVGAWICPADTPGGTVGRFEPAASALRIIQLEQELAMMREGLRSAIRDLAIAHAGQRSIREEARSTEERFRSGSASSRGRRRNCRPFGQTPPIFLLAGRRLRSKSPA